MARTKKKPVSKTNWKSATPKAKSTPRAKSKPKAKPAKSKSPKSRPAKPKPTKVESASAATSAVELEVAQLLASYDAGNVDNAWDVMPQIMELREQLPRSSKLYKAFNRMATDIEEICTKGELGED